MRFYLKPFDKLTVNELYDAIQLRCEIFVIEQNCNYQDLDDKDKQALHLLGYAGKTLVAYARLLAPSISYKEASIGRVVVKKNKRGKDLGKQLMQEAITHTQKNFKVNNIVISAQCYLEKFYCDFGFLSEGDSYLEDDIPHIKMRLISQ